MDQEKLAKLPQWAQREIQSLEASREGWKNRCEELNRANSESNVQLGDYVHGDFGLPPDSQVGFFLGDPPYRKFHDMIEVTILRTKDRKALRVSCSDGRMVITPSHSNAIELGIAER